MPALTESSTAAFIRQMAERHNVAYSRTGGDDLAHHMSRLADNNVADFDEIERLLIALQRAGHVSRAELVRLQARYLNESKT